MSATSGEVGTQLIGEEWGTYDPSNAQKTGFDGASRSHESNATECLPALSGSVVFVSYRIHAINPAVPTKA